MSGRWLPGRWRVGLGTLVGLGMMGGAYGQGKTWSPPLFMDTPRDAHTALVVQDRVLIIGGRIRPEGITTGRTDWYDPRTREFFPTGSMVGSRSFFPAVLLDDGRVLMPGGFHSRAGTIRSSQLFDPGTGQWTMTGGLAVDRELHTGTKLPNGQVLVTGGFSNNSILNSAELYDPGEGRFRFTSSMACNRFGHTATLLTTGPRAGQVLVTGGRTYGDLSQPTTEFYDPSPDSGWTKGPDLQHDRFRHTATRLLDGRLLITGGFSSLQDQTLASAEIYDPVTNTFTLLPGSMSDTRMDHTATRLPDGRVLIVGGWSSVKNSTVATGDLFDPERGEFTPTEPLPASRHEHTATLLPDGTVLVVGGLQWEPEAQRTLDDAYLFFP